MNGHTRVKASVNGYVYANTNPVADSSNTVVLETRTLRLGYDTSEGIGSWGDVIVLDSDRVVTGGSLDRAATILNLVNRVYAAYSTLSPTAQSRILQHVTAQLSGANFGNGFNSLIASLLHDSGRFQYQRES